MKFQTLFVFFFFAVHYPLFGQEVMTIRHSCNFYGEEIEEDKYIFPANAEAKRIIDEILKHSGLSAKFEIKESNCSNALATVEGKQRFILYNPVFLQQFKKDANTKWASYCVLAHEIAHHLNGHDLEETDPKKRRSFELEADKFAGFLLFHLGASLEEAQMGIQTIKQEGETNTHPPKTARLVAVANGWTQASDLSGGLQIVPAAPSDTTTPSKTDNMIFVKGGTFTMGSDDADADEKPVHSVTVSDFYLSKYEVTVAEFQAFVEASGYRTDAEKNGTSWIYESEWKEKSGINWRHNAQGKLRPQSEYNHPVIHVSWNDANEYCKWMSKKNGQNYRLPTEAEWEYAALGGNKSKRTNWAGTSDESQLYLFGNYRESGNSDKDKYEYTASVGSFKPNELGIFDMTGNVWEWCSDWYGTKYYENSPAQNPGGPISGSRRVSRGGSWDVLPILCRVANRNAITPNNSFAYLGFRLARSL